MWKTVGRDVYLDPPQVDALYLGNGSVGPNGTIRVFVGGVPYLITARKE